MLNDHGCRKVKRAKGKNMWATKWAQLQGKLQKESQFSEKFYHLIFFSYVFQFINGLDNIPEGKPSVCVCF